MQFRDLQKQYEVLKPKMDAAMGAVAASARFISGPQVKELEDRLAHWVGRKHCVSCANGTDALQLCLMAWGIGPGDAVFVPDFTFFASGEVVSVLGATPVFYDVCADTFNADPISLEKAITQAPKKERARRPKPHAGITRSRNTHTPITRPIRRSQPQRVFFPNSNSAAQRSTARTNRIQNRTVDGC